MALLQIAEPGMSADPHQHRLAVGIDLGTTNSLVATVKSAETVVLADHEGRKLLPSVVRYLSDGTTVVGHEARLAISEDSQNTIASVKRFMGRSSAEIKEASSLPYRFAESDGMLRVQTVAGEKSPVEISAEILKVLKDRAEEALGGELVGAVITVPAYFDDAQRQATKDAARLAGLNPQRIVTILFVMMGIVTALGGIVFSSRMHSGQPAANVNLEFDAITAVVLGGVSFTGGVGDMVGTILGVILIQAFNTGLIMVNVPSFWQYVARGALLLFALTYDYIRKTNREKALLEASKKALASK